MVLGTMRCDLCVRVHEHLGEDVRDPLELGAGQHSALSEEALEADEAILPVRPVSGSAVSDDVSNVLKVGYFSFCEFQLS